MEKRFLLAVVLCLLILMFYQSYMGKQQEQWKAAQEAAQLDREEAFAPAPPLPAATGRNEGQPGQPAPEMPYAGTIKEARPEAASLDMACKEVIWTRLSIRLFSALTTAA
jgi:hypothetical protein